MVALLVPSYVTGCAPAVVPPNDGAVDSATSATSDGGDATSMDARGDASATPMDATSQPDAMGPVDVIINPGRCGQGVRDCLCNCGTNATCQQTCAQSDTNCADCLFEALTMCCPMENSALETCIIESMCEDDACILTRCGTQWNALQSCARRREREPECLVRVQACLGPDYPAVQCVRDQ